jgi:transcriptional regulator with XRE-family HTH domain
MPPRLITPSSYVGPQVRKWRDRRGWSQQDLASRLVELGMTNTGWSQTKIHKLEAGKLTRVLVDDVFELAVALDVSPLYLLTPLEGHDEEGNAFKVWLGGRGEHKDEDGGRVTVSLSRWPREVRQWIRGVRPILSAGDYADDEAARSGQRFFLLESQPLSEWHLIAESARYAKRVSGVVTGLVGNESEDGRG